MQKLEALFAEHGVLLEVNDIPVRLIGEGLVEVGSWGMVGKYMPWKRLKSFCLAELISAPTV